MSWEAGGPVIRVNTLQLDRDELLRWDEWRAAATAYLGAQPEKFDFTPIIERHMSGAGAFFRWFWEQVNERSSEIVAELDEKAMEVKLWYDEHDLRPDWLFKGDGTPPSDWNGRLERAKRRKLRYEHGTQGFRVSVIDGIGTIELGSTDWNPLPK